MISDELPPENSLSPVDDVGILAKKKAQNRAAQKAFRERKQLKLEEMSVKLAQTERERAELAKELEKLKYQNALLSSEQVAKFNFPSTETFIDEMIPQNSPHRNSHLESCVEYHSPESGEKLLTVAAVWGYVNSIHEQNDDLEIDTMELIRKLRGNEKCHGQGPAYPLSLVNQVIKDCIVGLDLMN